MRTPGGEMRRRRSRLANFSPTEIRYLLYCADVRQMLKDKEEALKKGRIPEPYKRQYTVMEIHERVGIDSNQLSQAIIHKKIPAAEKCISAIIRPVTWYLGQRNWFKKWCKLPKNIRRDYGEKLATND